MPAQAKETKSKTVKLKYKEGKPVIESLEDVEQLIKENFPEGLEAERDKTFWNGSGGYIGFNLCRFVYTNEFAAELHAVRDLMEGKVGYSYGFEFKPHVRHHPKTDVCHEHWEVYTG
jgi:hypothetical protein